MNYLHPDSGLREGQTLTHIFLQTPQMLVSPNFLNLAHIASITTPPNPVLKILHKTRRTVAVTPTGKIWRKQIQFEVAPHQMQ